MPAATHTQLLALPTPPAKVSRYRSLRGKSVSEARATVETALQDQENIGPGDNGGILSKVTGKGSSRKRSKTTAGDNGPPPMPALSSMPSVPALPLQQKEANILLRPSPGSKWTAQGLPARADSVSVVSLQSSATLGNLPAQFPVPPPPPPALAPSPLTGPDSPPPAAAIGVATALTTDTAVDWQQARGFGEAQLLADEEAQRQRDEEADAAHWADEVARLEAETDRILTEQKKRDLARLQAQLAQAPGVALQQGTGLKAKSPVLEKFAFLTRGRRSNAATLSPTSSTCASVDFSRSNSLEPNLLPRTFIERGLVPMGVVNNGSDRQVQVRCKHVSLNLPVAAESTTVDILFGCSAGMMHPINTSTSIVLEKYTQLGLERRLRRYERVRDVMNSWDRDTQNSLLVLDQPSGLGDAAADADLDLSSVPCGAEGGHQPPPGFVLQLHHSQRPGKWSKRFVTLRGESGHMYAAKKADNKEMQLLCHLSDFDIYTPTEAQMRKHLKPPKKYCYAVKSQQKTTVFENTENFVHFFSTEDPAVATRFHALVHGWRSWYLVNRQVEVARQTHLKLEAEKPPQIVVVKHKPRKSISHVKVHGHRLKVSVDEAPYAIGAFQPLLDLNRFDKPIEEFGKDWVPDSSRFSVRPPPAHQHPSRERTNRPPPPPPQHTPPSPPPPPASDPVFAPTGLLGTDYAAKKAASTTTTTPATPPSDGPFTTAPTLLNGGLHTPPTEAIKPEPASWFPSATEHTARARSRSLSRPSTSSGVPPRRARHHPPLVNFASSGGGGGARFLEVPPRNVVGGRPSGKAPGVPPPPGGGGRQRSKSTAGVGVGRGGAGEPPPVPPLPLPRSVARDGSARDPGFGGRKGERERGREPRARGRSGTMRY